MLKLEIRPLTGLRALAATWVVMIHFTTQRNALVYRWEWFEGLAKPVISAGQFGVDLFFVLSGSCLPSTTSIGWGPPSTGRARAASCGHGWRGCGRCSS